ncbi:MAG TPA: metal ABC transporter permease, partial [Gammaproteobacteria bacterium]|nr:metal ABC transporter permease [Gammaproteobacteria bacterium]
LILPAASAAQFVSTIRRMMVLSAAFSMIITTSGLLLSYEPDLPSGATIIILAGIFYACSILIQTLRRKKARS